MLSVQKEYMCGAVSLVNLEVDLMFGTSYDAMGTHLRRETL